MALGYGLAELSSGFRLYPSYQFTWNLLLVFMFLIGLDLAYFSHSDKLMVELAKLARSLGFILGSIIGAFVTAYFVPSIQLKDFDYVFLWFSHDWHCGHRVKECTFRQYCTDE